ncbi:acylphosphatase [Fructilactobacillus fructivorans]|uniref:acylphosphatase n=1 Tax=Fructilactobacillus fructivorans TaxID=1614 RepID=UPI0002196F4D|nr:acylphosphatase [Fructilactobacillus fructivorans]
MLNNQSVKITVSGLVQGVGFRYSTKEIAEHYSISGSVKNMANGNVLIIASGSKQNLDKFINEIKTSPNSFAQIQNVKVQPVKLNQHPRSFTIKI